MKSANPSQKGGFADFDQVLIADDETFNDILQVMLMAN
jgi:hypothetical protein